jgi:hypothetical protein
MAVPCEVGSVEQFEAPGVGVGHLESLAGEGVQVVDLAAFDVDPALSKREFGGLFRLQASSIAIASRQIAAVDFRCILDGPFRYAATLNRRANFYVDTLARRCRRHAGVNTGSAVCSRLRSNAASGLSGDWGAVKHRDVSAIDRQLALLAAVSASIRRLGGKPSTALIDELLDERIASRRTPLGLAPAGRADGNRDADQRGDRTDDGPSGGIAHWAAPHHPESL